MDDDWRFCFSCFAREGVLVERRREPSAQDRTERAASSTVIQYPDAKRNRNVRPTHGGIDLLDEALELWGHMAAFHEGAPLPAIKIRMVDDTSPRFSGRAVIPEHRLVVTVHGQTPTSDALCVLAHELAHCATPRHRHDEVWAACYQNAAQSRYGVEHFSGRPAVKGYAADLYVRPALSRFSSGVTSADVTKAVKRRQLVRFLQRAEEGARQLAEDRNRQREGAPA